MSAQKNPRRVNGCLATIVAIILSLLLVFGMGIFTLMDMLTDIDTYNLIIGQTQLVKVAQQTILEIVLGQVGQSFPINLDAGLLGAPDLARKILPDAWVTVTTHNAITSLLDWLDDPQGSLPAIMIDLVPIKLHLTSPDGLSAILPLFQVIPPCPPGEYLPDILGGIPSCLPPGVNLTVPAQALAANFISTLPDSINLEMLRQIGVLSPQAINTLALIKIIYQQARLGLLVLAVVGILLFLVYLLIVKGSWGQTFRALGLPFILAGLLGTILLGTLYFFPDGLYLIPAQTGGNFSDLLNSVIRILLKLLASRWLTVTVIFWAAGILCLAASWFLERLLPARIHS